jgi:hypothetical protein
MKVKQNNDTTENPYKTISLIDGISVNGSYNLAADSMNWSNFNANLRLKLFKGLNINLSGAFETYLYALNSAGNPVRINTPRWEVGKFPRLNSTGTSCGYTFNNQTFKKEKKHRKNLIPTLLITKYADEEGYQTIKVPWSYLLIIRCNTEILFLTKKF